MPDLGVYVHVPFCERVCPYCDFAVVPGGLGRELEERYLDALRLELQQRQQVFSRRRLETVYLGGGTPSLLRPESVARIAEMLRDTFPGREREFTLELNPSTVERSRLPGFRAAGVDRLSVGVQSFDDEVLRRLGRAHRADEARGTLDAARAAGFENLSLDLIFAAPGQTLHGLAADLQETVAFAPEHVSTYELVVEAGTPFALADRRGQLARADSDGAADMMEAILRTLEDAGLHAYELTNYARPGRESRHNRRYWRREPVLGLGLGAWSSDPKAPGAPFGSRLRNTRNLGDYLDRVGRGESPADEREVATEATARSETVFLALRTREGLDAAHFRALFGAVPRDFWSAEITRLADEGLLAESETGDLRLSERGRLLSDLVCAHFVSAATGPNLTIR